MRKVFLQTQLGKPHEWTKQYIENVQKLGEFGWEWLIFTPNKIKSKGNVTVIPMDYVGFNRLVERTCGVNPDVQITPSRLPSKPMTDYMVAGGLIFAEYIKNADFWGITNWDVVYGRLDHFVNDDMLSQCDIYSDDVKTINGVFTLMRNVPEVNNLFKDIEGWEKSFQSPYIQGLDEYGLTELAGKVRFGYPRYYPLHSHDRLENHIPDIKLKMQEDGSLWELLRDINPPNWIHKRPVIGREVAYFHFQKIKKWPNIA